MKEPKEMNSSGSVRGHSFLPLGTMFKIGPPHIEGSRHLECVACGTELDWGIYLLASEKFDVECPTCGVKAEDYWKDKPHREINDGKEDNEAGDS